MSSPHAEALHLAVSKCRKNWTAINDKVVSTASTMVNTKILLQYLDQPQWGTLQRHTQVKNGVDGALSARLLPQTRMLASLLEQLLEQYSALQDAIDKLSAQLAGGVAPSSVAPVEDLSQVISWGTQILAMYRKELWLKHVVITQLSKPLAPGTSRASLEVYVASLHMDPYLDTPLLSRVERALNPKQPNSADLLG